MADTLKRIDFGDGSWIMTSEQLDDWSFPITTGEAARCQCHAHNGPHWHRKTFSGEEFVIAVNLNAVVGVEERV